MSTRLDHGVLNVPLSKRGNIDRQIDAYKRDQDRKLEAILRETSRQFASTRAEALGLISRLQPEHTASLAIKFRCQPRSVAKQLRTEAGLNPTLVVRALREGGAA